MSEQGEARVERDAQDTDTTEPNNQLDVGTKERGESLRTSWANEWLDIYQLPVQVLGVLNSP